MSDNTFVEIFKLLPRFLKYTIYSILFLISIVIAWSTLEFIYKAMSGKYAKLWILETHADMKYKDTVVVKDSTTNSLAYKAPSTIISSAPANIPTINRNYPIKNNKKANVISIPRTTLNNINGKNEVNTNQGINTGNIGGTGNTINNGIVPRIISNKHPLMIAFDARRVDTATNISFCAYGGADGEITNVRNQISELLRQRGYKHIENHFRFFYGGAEPDYLTFVYKQSDNFLQFLVPFASKANNVN